HFLCLRQLMASMNLLRWDIHLCLHLTVYMNPRILFLWHSRYFAVIPNGSHFASFTAWLLTQKRKLAARVDFHNSGRLSVPFFVLPVPDNVVYPPFYQGRDVVETGGRWFTAYIC